MLGGERLVRLGVTMDEFKGELRELLAAYRESLPNLEPSAQFMPGLWRRIDARRGSAIFLRRLTRALVMVVSLALLIISILIPRWQTPSMYTAAYVDALASTPGNDTPAFADILHAEPGFGTPTQ